MIASKFISSVCKNGARYFSSSNILNGPKVAVVLSGSGNLDGTDVHETATTLSCLSREGAEIECYSPDMFQAHIKNHLKTIRHKEDYPGDSRNMMEESARMFRGNVKPLSKLTSKDADAVIFPGGYGAGSSLSDFDTHFNFNTLLDEDVERVIFDFHKAKKPIGCSGLSVILIAKELGKHEVKLTVGCEDDGSQRWHYGRHMWRYLPFEEGEFAGGLGSVETIQTFFALHVEKLVHEVCVDEKHKVVSTPGSFCTCELYEIMDGTINMVQNVLKLTK